VSGRVQQWRTEDDQVWQSLYMLNSGLDVIGFLEHGDA
jgi:hypothetical protein